MQKLIDKSAKVDLILTDPPYQLTKCKWDLTIPLNEMWECINQLKKETTPTLLFGNEPYSSKVRLSNIKSYKYDIIWDKIIRTGHLNANKQPMRQYENIMVFYDKQCTYNPIMWKGKSEIKTRKYDDDVNVYGDYKRVPSKFTKMKYPTNIIKFNAREKECNGLYRFHPTQKPVKLLQYLIKTYTKEKDIVLDFTMGSGSTGVACLETNRNFIGIELDENYYNIAVDRCNSFQSKLI